MAKFCFKLGRKTDFPFSLLIQITLINVKKMQVSGIASLINICKKAFKITKLLFKCDD